jgi:PAS domain S-box-containing protein
VNDPDWNRRLESAALAALEKMATSAEAAEGLLGTLAAGLFPKGVASLDQVTWPERHGNGTTRSSLDPQAQAEARLRAAEARYRTLVEQIPAVTFMAVLGEGKNEMYVSPHIEQMLGFTQEEWLGNPFLWYRQLHPDDRSLWYDEFARGCQTGGPFKAECRFLSRDGRVVWVHGEARLVRDDAGRPLFLQGIGFDITESKRAQEVLLNEAVHTAKVEEELEIARRVQTSILPREMEVPRLEIAATMIPASEVGGDYYDVLPIPGGAWLAIGDVSGHGLNSGLVMLMVQSAMAALVQADPGAPPRDVLCRLNEVVYDNVRKRLTHDDHVTLSILRYTEDGRFVYAGAHEEMIVYRRATGRIELVDTPGTWVGARRGIWDATVDSTLSLNEGDILLLYTDGVTEARDANGRQFDIERLTDVLMASRDKPCERIVADIVAAVRAWMSEQADDISVMALRHGIVGTYSAR